MFEWFTTLWSGFLAMKPVEQASTAFTIGGVLLGWAVAWWAIATRRLRLKNAELDKLQELSDNRLQQIKNQRNELKEKNEAIAALEAQLPENWLLQAEKERKDGNEERAIRCLRVGFESICQPLSACCFELATHHFSLVTDYGTPHFHEAERLARIAMLLAPSDEKRLFLAELLAAGAEARYASGDYQTYDAHWGEVSDFLKIGTDDGSIEALHNAADQHMEQGRYRLAERLLRRLVQIYKRQQGQDAEITLRTRGQHAAAVGQAGRYREALSLCLALLPDLERVLGPDHPDVAQSLNNLANLYRAQGRFAEAEPLMQRALAILERALGPEHPNFAAGLENYADLLEQTGRIAEAAPLLERAQAIRERHAQANPHP